MQVVGPPDVDTLFRPGARRRRRDGTPVVVEVLDVGTLQLATGRLVAADPFFLGPGFEHLAVPFTTTAAPGRNPMSLSTTTRERPRHTTPPASIGPVAAARLTIRDDPVVVWELALQSGQNPATLQPGEICGFVVDSGTGCFLDASAVPALRRLGDPGPFAGAGVLVVSHRGATWRAEGAASLPTGTRRVRRHRWRRRWQVGELAEGTDTDDGTR